MAVKYHTVCVAPAPRFYIFYIYLYVCQANCVQNLTSWFEDSLLPFMALFAFHQFVEHFYSFLQLMLLLISTASSTLHLQALVATPPEHKLQKCRDVIILVSLNIWALSLLGLPDTHVWRAVFFVVPQQPLSVCSCCPACCVGSVNSCCKLQASLGHFGCFHNYMQQLPCTPMDRYSLVFTCANRL